ncbi:MAG TPA: hypothetical protein PK280_07460 [Planctomycetota bacterium]|nr:hypothetical protein [Planctomycetota bacterium]
MMAMGIVLYVAGVYNTVGGVINLAALFEPGDIPTNPISGGWSLAVGIAFVVLGALARRHHVWVNYWVCALSGLSLLVVLLTIAILAFCHGRMIGFGLACAFVLYGILAVLSIRNLSKVEKIESAGLDPRKAP